MSRTVIQGRKGPFVGEFTPPGDKSISHRAAIVGSVATGKSRVKGFLNSEDTFSTLKAVMELGSQVQYSAEGTGDLEVVITGRGLRGLKKPSKVIDAGNSGTTARLLLGLLSGQPFSSGITGDKYLKKRPMGRVVRPLGLMGADITGENGIDNLPLSIKGKKLHGISYDLPVASAQVKSALILAGLFASGVTEITEPEKTRDHTERILRYFGGNLGTDGNRITVMENDKFEAADLIIPSDVSSAAFFMIGALINSGSELLIKNVGLNSARTGIIEVLIKMGGDLRVLNQREECGEPVGDILIKSSELRGVEIKGSLIPKTIDELPIIAVAACFAEGRTTISEAKELRVKEVDRIKAMTSELQKLGAKVFELEDGMIIEGVESLRGAECKSWGDHRVAMSLCIAATRAEEETTINGADCINISYPGFFNTFKDLRAQGL